MGKKTLAILLAVTLGTSGCSWLGKKFGKSEPKVEVVYVDVPQKLAYDPAQMMFAIRAMAEDFALKVAALGKHHVVAVAPAIMDSGQMRPSRLGETMASNVTDALVRAAVRVVDLPQDGWTSGAPVWTAVRNKASSVGANAIASGSYHFVQSRMFVTWRLTNMATGQVLASASAEVDAAESGGNLVPRVVIDKGDKK